LILNAYILPLFSCKDATIFLKLNKNYPNYLLNLCRNKRKLILIVKSYLEVGDKVGLLSTARSFTFKDIEPFVELLQAWGLIVKIGNTANQMDYQFAGTTQQRANDLQQMVNDPDIKAIICVRGGYGTIKIVDTIDLNVLKTKPKFICGFSDVTVLHNYLHNQGYISLHTCMAMQFNDVDAFSKQSLKLALFGGSLTYAFKPHLQNKGNSLNGIVVGGNLSILHNLSGTKYDMDVQDKILFIEDLDEYLYHIDRMMMQLKLSGKLKKLKGILVGSFNKMNDNEVPFGKTVESIILDAVKEYDYPVIFNFPAGHEAKNYAIKLGCIINIFEKNGTMVSVQKA